MKYKDVNACLVAGVPMEVMRGCVRNARVIAPERLKTAYEFEQRIWEKFYPTGVEQEGLTLPWGNSHGKCMPFHFRYGEVTVWSGFNGHGKSQLLNYVMVDLASRGEKVLIASLEMQAHDTYYRVVRMATGRRKPVAREERDRFREVALDWVNDKIYVFDHVGTADLEEVLKVCLYARKRYGVRHVVLDSLMRFCMNAGDDQYEEQKKFMEKLVEFADRWGVHIHLVAHSKKLKSENEYPRKYDIAGSAAISNLAFNVIIVWRNKRKEQQINEIMEDGREWEQLSGDEQHKLTELAEQKDAFFIVDKQRGGEGDEPVRNLWFNRESNQFHEMHNMRPRDYTVE